MNVPPVEINEFRRLVDAASEATRFASDAPNAIVAFITAVSSRCGDDVVYDATCTRFFALSKILRSPKLGDWVERTERVTIIHPSVIALAATFPVNRRGLFNQRKFIGELKDSMKQLRLEDACEHCFEVNVQKELHEQSGYIVASYTCTKCHYRWTTTWDKSYAEGHSLNCKADPYPYRGL